MIGYKEIRAILSLYEKHGWIISRVLLSTGLSSSLSHDEKASLFGDAPLSEAPFDAAWFERDRDDGRTAWEIRLLSNNVYALCESYPDSCSIEEIEAKMKIMEKRIQKQAAV